MKISHWGIKCTEKCATQVHFSAIFKYPAIDYRISTTVLQEHPSKIEPKELFNFTNKTLTTTKAKNDGRKRISFIEISRISRAFSNLNYIWIISFCFDFSFLKPIQWNSIFPLLSNSSIFRLFFFFFFWISIFFPKDMKSMEEKFHIQWKSDAISKVRCVHTVCLSMLTESNGMEFFFFFPFFSCNV